VFQKYKAAKPAEGVQQMAFEKSTSHPKISAMLLSSGNGEAELSLVTSAILLPLKFLNIRD
jgi:hypothetical protein